MYFIATGTVALYDGDKEVCHLNDGEYFGYGAVSDDFRHYRLLRVTCVEICRLFKVTKDVYELIIQEHEIFETQLDEIEDERNENGIVEFERTYSH